MGRIQVLRTELQTSMGVKRQDILLFISHEPHLLCAET